MMKRIGYRRVSASEQDTGRGFNGGCCSRDDLYTDRGSSGARASRPEFDRVLTALEEGDTLVVTTLDRLGRS